MQPKSENVRDLAVWAPKIAYAMVVGVPRVPFVVDIPIQFTSSAVDAPAIIASFDNNLTQDTIIEKIAFTLFQQNTFPGSPFQSLYFSQLKNQTGVGVKFDVYGAPRYSWQDTYIDLANVADIWASTWPNGLLLPKQSNVKLSAILFQTPVSVPFDVNVTFLGWSALDPDIDALSDNDARCRLRKLGFDVPDLSILLARP
jgi:hypothetical protein